MSARVPLDVDLEDRILYGLTPMRLGYLVVFGLAAMTVWSLHWMPPPVRGGLCGLLVLVGVAIAWGRLRARPLDAWAVDITLYLIRNYRFEFDRAALTSVLNRWRRPPPRRLVLVSEGAAENPGAAVAARELAAAISAQGARYQVLDATGQPSPPADLVSCKTVVVQADRRFYLPHCGATIEVPDDPLATIAARRRQPVVVAYPDSAAARAYRHLAYLVAQPP